MFSRDVTEYEWLRFEEYARRVKELHFGDGHLVDPSVWVVLSRRRPRQPLLPTLHGLQRFAVTDPTSALAEIILLSSTLRDIEIDMSALTKGPRPLARMLLEEVKPVFANAESLSVEFAHTRDALSTKQECAIPKHLRSLGISNWLTLEPGNIDWLSTLRDLRSLRLCLHEVDVGDYSLREPLAALRELKLMSRGPKTFGDFLDVASPSMLQTFAMEIKHPQSYHTSNNFRESLRGVYTRLPTSLTRLEASFQHAGYGWVFGTHLTESLRRFPCLQRISFHLDGALIGITDSELLALTEGETTWPQLVALEFTYPPAFLNTVSDKPHTGSYHLNWNNVDPPAITSILAFVAAHPRLERLAIPFADAHPDCVPSLDALTVPHHNLRSLRIIYVHQDFSLRKVARVLDSAFPRLDPPDEGGWPKCPGDELDSIIFALQVGRNAARMQLKESV